jgi:hypothetical protein
MCLIRTIFIFLTVGYFEKQWDILRNSGMFLETVGYFYDI